MNIFSNSHYDRHEKVLFGYDEASGLRAMIAIHNTNLGPALGGCRMHAYASEADALADVLRLSRGMTYKSALAELPLGGGKSVIIGDPTKDKRPDLLAAMGRFVDSAGGRYIVAKDMGICVPDLLAMAKHTSHISGVGESVDADGQRRDGDPSPSTAYGVFCGIKTSINYLLGRKSLDGLRVAIQGLGSVGFSLAGMLRNEGAELFVSDINAENVQRAVQSFDATPVDPDSVLTLPVDVLSPCAMGAVINDETVDRIQAKLIAGAANNQLARPEHGERLFQRGILYAPDYAINAGGIIDAYYMDTGKSAQSLKAHVENIATTLERIYHESRQFRLPTQEVADRMAERRFQMGERMAS
jgi:leucine dehydrogenase